jgi:hypothetical protein
MAKKQQETNNTGASWLLLAAFSLDKEENEKEKFVF